MSDLKVWVDGKERVIRGVSKETTCESVVLVLAQAAGKSGKVALLEKWREFERILPRNENPLKCLEAWGTHKQDVYFVLRDDDVTRNTIDSINLGIDNNSEAIKRSVDSELPLESFTALQVRKLNSLSRALEIVDYQLSFWDDDDEKFLYLTEDEIIEDFSLKLSRTVKLQGKELVEFEGLQAELRETQRYQETATSKLKFYSDRILQIESEIANTYDVVRKILNQIKSAKQDEEKELNVRNELQVLQTELDEQKDLSLEQNNELKAIKISLSELTRAFHFKTNRIEFLENELKLAEEKSVYDLNEDFRPLSSEEEHNFHRHSLFGDGVESQLSRIKGAKAISETVQDVNSDSNGSQVANIRDLNLRRSSAGSPQEVFRNWSSSKTICNLPLDYYPVVNWIKERNDNGLSSFSSKSETDLQTSVTEGKKQNVTGIAINGKVEFPFSETRRENPLKKSLENENDFGTKESIGGKKFQVSGIQNKNSLDQSKAAACVDSSASFPSGEKLICSSSIGNSLVEIKLHKDVKLHSVENTSPSFSQEKDKLRTVVKTSFNPTMKARPLKDNFSISGLPMENSTLKLVPHERKKIDKLPPPATLPKPQRKSSESLKKSGNIALSSLSNPTIDKGHLLPPNVQHRKSTGSYRKERPRSHGDLYEKGVFV